MKYALVIFAAVLLVGCDYTRSESAPGYHSVRYRLTCIDGVTYLAANGLTAKLDKDSKIVPCN